MPTADQTTKISPEAFRSKEMLTVKLRYKDPDGSVSKLIERPLIDAAIALLASEVQSLGDTVGGGD